MITINLLPESYRKPKTSSIQQFHRSPLGILVGVVLVVLLLALGALWQVNTMRLASLNARLQELAPQKRTLDDLKASVQTLRDHDAVFQHVSRERRRWARLLNVLSDVVPDNVWFTDLSLDSQGLVVQGSAIAHGGEEMVRIGRLVQDLKANPEFVAVIQDIQIESIKTVQEKEIELVEFTLTCKLTGPAQPGTL